jgi:hypothetical protein
MHNDQYNIDYDLLNLYFDRERYLTNYSNDKDINPSDPLGHYMKIGAKKGVRSV